MNLFRSEEHIVRWLDGRAPGMTTSVTVLAKLAHAWWGNRLDAAWAPRSVEASQAILDLLGLTGPNWRLG